MKHLGDITAIDWSKVEPVDVVTGGSPCQDLSVAGKRAGLAGERSGLYMEQIRCVKELREADVLRGRTGEFIRPRYMVWENVPGAFSSGNPKGADFAAVIEEIIKVVEQDAYVCVMPPSSGWTKSGCYYDSDGRWSIAWRVHDAQFWGVPQRRKRIALVADFGGLTAPEILFERKGLSGHFEQSGAQREGAAPTTGSCAAGAECYGIDHVMLSGGTTYQGRGYYDNVSGCLKTQPHGCISFQERAGCPGGGKGILIQPERTGALSTLNNQSVCYGVDLYNQTTTGDVSKTLNSVRSDAGHTPCVCYGIGGYNSEGMKSANPHSGIYEAETSRTLDLNGGSPACNQGGIAVVEPSTYQNVTGPLMANSHPGSYCGQDAYQDMLVAGLDCRNGRENGDLCGTLQSKPNGGFSYNCIHPVRCNNIVRRLTPLECERLQGYPDGWTDIGEWIDSKGKKHKEADSPRYKALGNSIALPFWKWLLKRISAQYERDATLGSLFDGIGGFPLCWEQINGKGTARWASEIEEFPIAVTKIRFPEE